MNSLNLELKYWMQLTCAESKRISSQTPKLKIAPSRIFLGDKFPDVYLTQREAQCVYYLNQNKKRREIAELLNLSIRTVEAYITEAKIKTNCHSQKELVKVMAKTHFLKNYLEKRAIKQRVLTTGSTQAATNSL